MGFLPGQNLVFQAYVREFVTPVVTAAARLIGYVCIRDGSHRGVPFLVGISLGTCVSQAFLGIAGGDVDTLLID